MYKLTNYTSCHNGFQFKEGLNIDTIPFNTTRECSPGGMYFTTSDDFYRYLMYNDKKMYWVYDVEIPPEAKVHYEPNGKAKTDRFILKNKRPISELKEWDDENFQFKVIKYSDHFMRYIPNPTRAVKLKVVSFGGDGIHHIKNPDEELKLAAVTSYAHSIRFIDDPSEEVQLVAVKQSGMCLQWIANPTYKVKFAAVTECGLAIKFVENPDDALKNAAITQNRMATAYID